MRRVLLYGPGRRRFRGLAGWLGSREVDLPVGGACEDVGSAEGGEGDGVDGARVGGERIHEARGDGAGHCEGKISNSAI